MHKQWSLMIVGLIDCLSSRSNSCYCTVFVGSLGVWEGCLGLIILVSCCADCSFCGFWGRLCIFGCCELLCGGLVCFSCMT